MENYKTIIESLLFVNEKPIEAAELSKILELDKKKIDIIVNELIDDYKNRDSGICVVKVAGGYQMCSHPENETWVRKMCKERNKQKLSNAALETLAIIAYKQPLTRMEVEAIRGVNVDGVVRKLTKLGLIKTSGRKNVVGKPFLYITTRLFLEYFGLDSINDLPQLEDFRGFDNIKADNQQQADSEDIQEDVAENKAEV
jgi:segregation and condensation protein B